MPAIKNKGPLRYHLDFLLPAWHGDK